MTAADPHTRQDDTAQPNSDTPPFDVVMELATPLLREAFNDMPPEQAAVTALGRRIRSEVERIYTAGRAEARLTAAAMVEEARLEAAVLLHMERQHGGHGRDGHLDESDLVPLLRVLQVDTRP
ncbi:hypothetical protein [Micromonospora tulbaghiae]|uniref:hypothetical protein n=1 Tax=Micromonospora tulbaghiae TaxID=479978 RepID=UPI0033E0B9B2